MYTIFPLLLLTLSSFFLKLRKLFVNSKEINDDNNSYVCLRGCFMMIQVEP